MLLQGVLRDGLDQLVVLRTNSGSSLKSTVSNNPNVLFPSMFLSYSSPTVSESLSILNSVSSSTCKIVSGINRAKLWNKRLRNPNVQVPSQVNLCKWNSFL